jgi:hypothetical protein
MEVSLMVGGSLRRRAALAVVGLVAASVGVGVAPVAAADAVVATETGDALEVAGSLVADAAPVVDAGDSFVATVAGSDVELPADPAEPLVLDGPAGEISVDLPVVPGGGDGVVDDSGAVVYESDVSPVSFAAQATADGGMQVLVVIEGPDAPTEYRFDLTVPAGAALQTTPDGGAEVVGADGGVVSVVAPAWALDAKGTQVPTRYRIEGTTLVQVIDHHGATYPVVGDPNWDVFWNRVAIYFNRAETKTISNMGWGATGLTAVCGLAGGPVFAAACFAQSGYIVYQAGVAYNSRGCLQLYKYHGPFAVQAKKHNGGTCEL